MPQNGSKTLAAVGQVTVGELAGCVITDLIQQSQSGKEITVGTVVTAIVTCLLEGASGPSEPESPPPASPPPAAAPAQPPAQPQRHR